MKLSYKERFKEPFILELSLEELGLIRYHLGEAIFNGRATVARFQELKPYVKDPDVAAIYEQSERDYNQLVEVGDTLERLVMSWIRSKTKGVK